MIHFKCPACQAVLMVPDNLGGVRGNCMYCNHEFVAPSASTFDPNATVFASTGDSRVQSTAGMSPTQAAEVFATINQLKSAVVTFSSVLWTNAVAISKLQGEVERRTNDIVGMLLESRPEVVDPGIRLQTNFPVAVDSVDHTKPRGSKDDNTRWPRFVTACERHFKRPLKYIDLGCAGGGLVLDFLLRGHRAIGLEGSDYSQRNLRAEWRTIPHNLFTCDVSRPFTLRDERAGEPFRADVISMWEVLEHIPRERLPVLLHNIREHLVDDGIFVGSVATFDDVFEETHYHATVEPRAWWEEAFRQNGLAMTAEHIFDKWDYCRGIGRDATDCSYYSETFTKTEETQFRSGFHVVARRSPLGPRAGQVPPPIGVAAAAHVR